MKLLEEVSFWLLSGCNNITCNSFTKFLSSVLNWVKNMNCKRMFAYSIGFIFIIFGILLTLFWHNIFTSLLNEKLQIKEGSMTFKNWIVTKNARYLEVYLFKWTNPKYIYDNIIIPNFQEYGPLIFMEKRTSEDLNLNSNSTISYYRNREWYFQPHLSNGTLDEPITNANLLFANFIYIFRDKMRISDLIINFISDRYRMVWRKPADQWLFNGIEDPYLLLLRKCDSSVWQYPFDKFGWFVGRNNSKTYDGHFQINTGVKNIKKLGELTQWNYSRRTEFYPDHCGIINGTTNEIWPGPENISKNKYLSVFISDICRSINIYPANDLNINGINGEVWQPTRETFDIGQISKDNSCFCTDAYYLNNCKKNGVIDISKCFWNIPIAVSFPYYDLADPSYIKDISGISPSSSKNKFFVALNQDTGVELASNLTFQYNFEFLVYRGKYKPKHLFPVVWIKESNKINEETASELKALITLKHAGLFIGLVSIGIGLLIMLIGIIVIKNK